MAADAGNRAQQHCFDSLPLADFSRHVARQAFVRRAIHVLQRIAHAIFGKDIQKRRLAQLCGKRLLQRPIKNGLARGVGKVRQQNRVLVGKRDAFSAQGKVSHHGPD